MSELRNRPPTELLEMFERREGDVRPASPMPPRIRRRIRTRRGVAAAAVVALSALVIGFAIKTLPGAFDSRPAEPSPTPPATDLLPTASGQTQLYRWRVLAGPGTEGRIETELQTSSLAGGDWSTVAERSFDPAGPSFTATFNQAGPFVDRPTEVLVWGFVPNGADRVRFEPGEGCDTIMIAPEDVVAVPGAEQGIWGTVSKGFRTRCGGAAGGTGEPGTITALGPSGEEVASNGYGPPVASHVWAVTTARRGGVGWILQRLADQPTGVAIGDAGIPNDLRMPIRGDQLSSEAPIAWETTPPAADGTFVFGLAVPDVAHVVLVLSDGRPLDATLTVGQPGDAFSIFYADVADDVPAQLVAFDATCEVLANGSMNGNPVGDPPTGACTPER